MRSYEFDKPFDAAGGRNFWTFIESTGSMGVGFMGRDSMMRVKPIRMVLLGLGVWAVLGAGPAQADRGWGWGCGMMGLATGALVGAELANPYRVYPYPYYPAPVVYAAPPVVVQQQPVVYSSPPQAQPPRQQSSQSMAPPPPGQRQQTAANSWYYCASAKGYYPYVQNCPEPWRTVPAAPPGAPH